MTKFRIASADNGGFYTMLKQEWSTLRQQELWIMSLNDEKELVVAVNNKALVTIALVD